MTSSLKIDQSFSLAGTTLNGFEDLVKTETEIAKIVKQKQKGKIVKQKTVRKKKTNTSILWLSPNFNLVFLFDYNLFITGARNEKPEDTVKNEIPELETATNENDTDTVKVQCKNCSSLFEVDEFKNHICEFNENVSEVIFRLKFIEFSIVSLLFSTLWSMTQKTMTALKKKKILLIQFSPPWLKTPTK